MHSCIQFEYMHVIPLNQEADYCCLQTQDHRKVYLQYSRFWLQQPAEEFALFLSELKSKNLGHAQELKAFDEAIAKVS